MVEHTLAKKVYFKKPALTLAQIRQLSDVDLEFSVTLGSRDAPSISDEAWNLVNRQFREKRPVILQWEHVVATEARNHYNGEHPRKDNTIWHLVYSEGPG